MGILRERMPIFYIENAQSLHRKCPISWRECPFSQEECPLNIFFCFLERLSRFFLLIYRNFAIVII